MIPARLDAAIAEDRANGWLPMAVVATVGTTSTTSVDPVEAIAAICRRERIWLHVDAAYAGVAAIVPEYAWILRGAADADSLVVNPHKWLFTPFDLSVLYCRRMDVVRTAFSLTPEYLKTGESGDRPEPDGHRHSAWTDDFARSSCGWCCGTSALTDLRDRLGEHMRLARLFASWVDESDDFERVAPVPFSVVCFVASGDDAFNERLLDAVNASGEIFISHTRLQRPLHAATRDRQSAHDRNARAPRVGALARARA